MNYTTNNEKIITALEDFYGKIPKNSTINFSVDYSQRRKLSNVIIQVVGGNDYQFLIFVYTKSFSLYDILKYRNHNFVRVGQLAKLTPQVNLLNQFILNNIPNFNPWSSRKIRENAVDNDDFKIEKLQNQIEQLKNKNRSYRAEIANLKDKIKILNNKNKNTS